MKYGYGLIDGVWRLGQYEVKPSGNAMFYPFDNSLYRICLTMENIKEIESL